MPAFIWARKSDGTWARLPDPANALPRFLARRVHQFTTPPAERPRCPLRTLAFHSAMCGVVDHIQSELSLPEDYAEEEPLWYGLIEQDAIYHHRLVEDFPVLEVVSGNYDRLELHHEFEAAEYMPRGKGGGGGVPWRDAWQWRTSIYAPGVLPRGY